MFRAWVAAGLLFVCAVANAFDHTHKAWTEMLEAHVVLVDGGRSSRVDYTGFADDRPELKAYLGVLSAVPLREYMEWTRPQRLAFLLNAYNAFTVEKVLTRYPDLHSIRDFGRVFGNPFKDRFFTLLGRPANLDGIEHEMIRAPGAFDDPRIHFALNCASVGCPMLREEAYVAHRLDRQLDEQTMRFLSDRSRNRWRDGGLEISRIFDWYGGDFEARSGSVAAFLARFAAILADRPADQSEIRQGTGRLRFLDYDWSLNDAKR